jgi:hypothetical protein
MGIESYSQLYSTFNVDNVAVMGARIVLMKKNILKVKWYWQKNLLNLSHEFRKYKTRNRTT